MNIVNSGDRFMVYGEEVKTYKSLPANTYALDFDQMKGFSLKIHNDLVVNEKIYGPYAKKVQKVMNSFNVSNRNLGIILSGPKGVGKSVFARLLAEEGKKVDLPLIIVSNNYPGLSDYISSIQQECIILFDEFEKMFSKGDANIRGDEGPGAQDSLLSLFDGIDNGKKLHVITCNNYSDLSTYLLNRPGRFHYHFKLNSPMSDDIREYLNDNLIDDAKKYIDEIVTLSNLSTFTYDILRAIVFELNQGYDLEESLQDLNIERDARLFLDMSVTFANGITIRSTDPVYINYSSDRFVCYRFFINKSDVPIEYYRYCGELFIKFDKDDLSVNKDGYFIDKDKVRVEFDDDWQYIDADTDDKRALRNGISDFIDTFKIIDVSIKKFDDHIRKLV